MSDGSGWLLNKEKGGSTYNSNGGSSDSDQSAREGGEGGERGERVRGRRMLTLG